MRLGSRLTRRKIYYYEACLALNARSIANVGSIGLPSIPYTHLMIRLYLRLLLMKWYRREERGMLKSFNAAPDSSLILEYSTIMAMCRMNMKSSMATGPSST